MSSLKIAVKIGGLPDIKVKLKIEMENNPKTGGVFTQKQRQPEPRELASEDSTEMDPSQTEIPDITVQSGSWWRSFLSRVNIFGRKI